MAEGIDVPHGAGHRRHLERAAGRAREAPRHRRRPHGLQGRRRRRRGGRLPRRGRAAGAAHATTAPGRSASPSAAARCPARRSRCSRCRQAGWPSGSASTASPASTRRTSPTADELAELFVDALLHEVPEGRRGCRGARVGADPQRPGQREVRGAVRRLPHVRPAAPRRTGVDGRRARGRRVLHQLRHGRLLADPAVARRRAGAALARTGRRPGVPPRLGQRPGARRLAVDGREPHRRRDPAGQRRVPAGGRVHRRPAGRAWPRPSTRRPTSWAGWTRWPATATTASACSAAAGPVRCRRVRGRRRCGCRYDAGRGRRRLVRPGRRYLRGDLGADPADPGGTEAVTRALVESHDTISGNRWFTVGVSPEHHRRQLRGAAGFDQLQAHEGQRPGGVTARKPRPPMTAFPTAPSGERLGLRSPQALTFTSPRGEVGWTRKARQPGEGMIPFKARRLSCEGTAPHPPRMLRIGASTSPSGRGGVAKSAGPYFTSPRGRGRSGHGGAMLRMDELPGEGLVARSRARGTASGRATPLPPRLPYAPAHPAPLGTGSRPSQVWERAAMVNKPVGEG